MTNKTTQELSAAGGLTGAELVHVVQGGNSRRTTAQAIANLAGGSGSASGYHEQPTIVQKTTIRNDGNMALPAAPTAGNMLLFVSGGFGGTILSYAPPGFAFVHRYQSNSSNAVAAWVKVATGDEPANYPVSASDHQYAALYEIANASTVFANAYFLDIRGNAVAPNFSLNVPTQFQGQNELHFLTCTNDAPCTYSINPSTGLTVDFLIPNDGNYHPGFILHYDSTFSGTVQGTMTSNIQPVAGVFTVLGKFVSG